MQMNYFGTSCHLSYNINFVNLNSNHWKKSVHFRFLRINTCYIFPEVCLIVLLISSILQVYCLRFSVMEFLIGRCRIFLSWFVTDLRTVNFCRLRMLNEFFGMRILCTCLQFCFISVRRGGTSRQISIVMRAYVPRFVLGSLVSSLVLAVLLRRSYQPCSSFT